MNRVTSRMLEGRKVLSDSEVFSAVKFNMNWAGGTLSADDLSITFNILELKRKYKYRVMMEHLKNGRIVLCYDKDSNIKVSTIQCAPAIVKSKADSMSALCNLTGDLQVSRSVGADGRMAETFLVPDSDVLYEFLKFGLVIINTGKLLDNTGIRNRVAEVYTDLMCELLTRRFGSSGDGDKLRFIVKYFFFNGAISVDDLCIINKFNPGKAKEMEFKYPNYFGESAQHTLTLTELAKVINSEFKAMKQIDLADLIKACAITYSEQSVFMMENPAYLLCVIVNSDNKFSQFKSIALRQYGPNLRTLVKDILDICE